MVCKISHLKRELLSWKISQSPFFLKCRTERKICLSIYIHLSDKVRGLSIHVGVQRKRKSNIWRESNWETCKIQKKRIEYTYLWKERERILNNFVEKGRSEVIAWDLRTNKLCLLLQMLDMLLHTVGKVLQTSGIGVVGTVACPTSYASFACSLPSFVSSKCAVQVTAAFRR